MSKPVASARPDVFNATVQGKLENALSILKTRYTSNFPAFIKAVSQYQEKLGELAAAGLKLSAELSRLGVNYKTRQGENMARLGQQMTEVENLRNGLAARIGERFTGPMSKSLANEKTLFSTNEKKILKTIETYEGELQRMIQQLAKEQTHGTIRTLENVAAITKKVQEFDAVNVEMLRDLQQSQQKQYIQWSEHWHNVVAAQLEYHVLMETRLEKLKPLWTADTLPVAHKEEPAAESPAPAKEKKPAAERGKAPEAPAPAAAPGKKKKAKTDDDEEK